MPKEKRTEVFDKNRSLEHKLHQQKAVIEEQKENDVQQEQSTKPTTCTRNEFKVYNRAIQKNKAFGEKSQPYVLEMSSQQSMAVQKMINEKILGEAVRCSRELDYGAS